jgi:hypothetical protein
MVPGSRQFIDQPIEASTTLIGSQAAVGKQVAMIHGATTCRGLENPRDSEAGI